MTDTLLCFQNVTLVSAIDIYEDEEAELLLSYNCKTFLL